MKALPLWQPWASLVAIEAKRIETRSWPAPRRLLGERIAIHATKGGLLKRDELDMILEPYFYANLSTIWPTEHLRGEQIRARLPRGAIIATAVLDRCLPIDRHRARSLAAASPREFAFGDYTPGRYAWVFRNVERLAEPIPFKGSQGIFDVPDDLLGVVPTQLTISEAA